MNMAFVNIILALLVAFGHVRCANAELKLENHEYKGLLVAIHKDVSDRRALTQNLQDYVRRLSSSLYHATNRRSLLGEVTILLPSTWSNAGANHHNVMPAVTETFSAAHIRVARTPHDSRGDEPWTRMAKAWCGAPGEYIQLTDGYLRDRFASEKRFGPIGNILVREFARLRWGLHDEYPHGDQANPCDVYGNGTIMTCSANLPVHRASNKGCQLIPNINSHSPNASLMFMAKHGNIRAFCDKGTHSFDMENDQNDICEKSAWEVMREHEDFKNGANGGTIAYRLPTFKFVQVSPRRNMVVIDTSAVQRHGGLEAIQSGLKDYIRITPKDSFLGMVKFSYSADSYSKVIYPLTKIDKDGTLEMMIQKLPTERRGSSCIKCGIEKAVKELERTGPAEGGIITLFTDGFETIGHVKNIIPRLRRKRVIVECVLYNTQPEHALKMKAVSDATGGGVRISHYTDVFLNSMDLMIKRTEDVTDIPIVAYYNDVTLRPNTYGSGRVSVDVGVSRETVFMFSWPLPKTAVSISVALSNEATNKGTLSFHPDPEWNKHAIMMEGTVVGDWKYKLSHGNPNRTLTVKAMTVGRPMDKPTYQPVFVESFVNEKETNLQDGKRKYVTIYAVLSQGAKHVAGCHVLAEINNGDFIFKVPLLDNGAGSDLKKNDGIYSAKFFNFTKDGPYSVIVHAVGKDILKGSRFSRVASGGYFSVTGSAQFNESVHNGAIPPSRVTDLKISQHGNGAAVLTWTAVGGDFDVGRAYRYEIRRSTDIMKLRKLFHETMLFTSTDSNVSSPLSAGQQETVSVRIRDSGRWGIAVVSVDKDGYHAPVSNVVYMPIKSPPSPPSPALSDVQVVFLVMAAICIVFVGLVIVFVMNRKNKLEPTDKSGKRSCEPPPYSMYANPVYSSGAPEKQTPRGANSVAAIVPEKDIYVNMPGTPHY